MLAAQAWLGIRAGDTLSALGPLPESGSARPPVSVVVSALDPGRRVERLLVSLQPALQPGDELIVVAGTKSEQARAVAGEFGARVIELGAVPRGWRAVAR